MFGFRESVEAGGLMGYAGEHGRLRRPLGRLRRQDPARREARRPSGRAADRFELIVNLKTAKAIGITLPQSVLLQADGVIQ
jgi:putative ABC transport system substrate-binding protein